MTTSSDELLHSALTGDEGAYRELVEPYRTELHAYCYRMLGSLDEIDDALQEALLGSAPSPEARYEQRESVELAFTVANERSLRSESSALWPLGACEERPVQDLTPQQRAVLIMRDVLGFSANEVAGSRELVAGYAAAWEKGDVSAIVAMLTEDAHFTMPPGDVAHDGHAAITEFLRTGPLTVRWRFIPVQASGQVAFGTYSWDSATGSYRADALDVLTLRDDRVSAITAFRMPEIFDRFGLPAAVVR